LLFQTYHKCIEHVTTYYKDILSQSPGETDKAFERRVRIEAIDVCRFLLPAASLANVGVTINARALEYAICKMLSSPLSEVREIGEELRSVAKIETPTLIKYAACNEYLVSTRENIRAIAHKISPKDQWKWFNLISYNADGEDEILAGILFRFGDKLDFNLCRAFVKDMDAGQKRALVRKIMAARGAHDQPLRELEYAQMTFEVVMDQGAYFEFKRHRMMTQTVQPLVADLGFALPKALVEAGMKDAYEAAMQSAASLYKDLAEVDVDLSGYVIPNGFNRRVLFTMNLREAFNFVRLRSALNAHFSIRRVSQRIVESIRQIYPLFGQYLDVPAEETWQNIEDTYFSSTS
jgi:thymidylate synthase ThyX